MRFRFQPTFWDHWTESGDLDPVKGARKKKKPIEEPKHSKDFVHPSAKKYGSLDKEEEEDGEQSGRSPYWFETRRAEEVPKESTAVMDRGDEDPWGFDTPSSSDPYYQYYARQAAAGAPYPPPYQANPYQPHQQYTASYGPGVILSKCTVQVRILI